MKVCKTCAVEKTAQEFSKTPLTKDGLFGKCKVCTNKTRAVTRKKYEATEKAKAYKTQYNKNYWAANKEKLKEDLKRFHERNPDYQRELNRKNWPKYADCDKYKAHRRAYLRVYRRENPGIVGAAWARRRAAQRTAIPAFVVDTEFNTFTISEIYHLANLRSKLTRVPHHVDHIVPLQSEIVCGLHWYANLQVIPAKENQMKSNKYWENMP